MAMPDRPLVEGADAAVSGKALADAHAADHPLPRRQPRPGGQGGPLPGSERRRRSGRARCALRAAGRRRARDPRRLGDPRGARPPSRDGDARARGARASRSPSAAASAPRTTLARLLEAGADKVAINTAAVADPELLGEIAERFGRQCTVLAIDAARRDGAVEVLIKGGRERTGVDAVPWAREGTERGAGEILLTSWDRDGTARRLRPRADAGDRGCGPRPGDRLGRRRRPGAPGGGLRCRRRRRARGLDLPRRRADRRRRQAARSRRWACRCGRDSDEPTARASP